MTMLKALMCEQREILHVLYAVFIADEQIS